MDILPSVTQDVPEDKIDKFLLFSKDLKEAKEELAKALQTDSFKIIPLQGEKTVATHQIIYPYEKMYYLRGKLFQTVEFLFDDYDYYSLVCRVETKQLEIIPKDTRIAQIITNAYDGAQKILLFKTPKARIDFYLENMNVKKIRDSYFPISFYHLENFGICFESSPMRQTLEYVDTYTFSFRSFKVLSALRIYELMKYLLKENDILLAGINGTTFYFPSKEIYERALSKRECFLQLGYEMKAPNGENSGFGNSRVIVAQNEKDFKDLSKENKE
jgi:hypothetical protein